MPRPSIQVDLPNGDFLTLEIEPTTEISAVLWSDSRNTFAELQSPLWRTDGRPSLLLTATGLSVDRASIWLLPAAQTAVEDFLRAESLPYEDFRT